MKFTFVIAALFLSATQAVMLQKESPDTGAPIPICNGANSHNCVEADVVVKHIYRRPFKRAASGDPDFADQEKADDARAGKV